MLDFDLAALYEVETKVFNQAVKRNIKRFPKDFMFQLTRTEWYDIKTMAISESIRVQQLAANRSQVVASSQKHRAKTALPYALSVTTEIVLWSVPLPFYKCRINCR